MDIAPDSYAEAAEMLRELAPGAGVRISGGATKLGWGRPVTASSVLSTKRLDAVVEHNTGDFTVVVQSGMPLGRLQDELREAGQRVSLDPPLGDGDGATVGGIVASGDAGPLRHRYGAPRDLILGVSVALADGTVAKAGGRVIKNVAGYDLGKLFAGSFGTLGVICQVALRLHPLPAATATVVGRADEPAELAAGGLALAAAPLEAESLDLCWSGGAGAILVRLAGPAAARVAGRAQALLDECGLATEVAEGAAETELWRAQREAQRAPGGAVVRVSATSDRLAEVLEATREAGASMVGRAAAGICWLTLPEASDDQLAGTIAGLRRRLGLACTVLDAPESLRAQFDVWGLEPTGETQLMGAVRERFDPERRCNPGIFGEAI